MFLFTFPIYWLILFNSYRYYTNFFNPIVELVLRIGIPTKEAKAEKETVVEITISKWAI